MVRIVAVPLRVLLCTTVHAYAGGIAEVWGGVAGLPNARNVTVYHVNPKRYGAIPFNMDAGDARGDFAFHRQSLTQRPEAAPADFRS